MKRGLTVLIGLWMLLSTTVALAQTPADPGVDEGFDISEEELLEGATGTSQDIPVIANDPFQGEVDYSQLPPSHTVEPGDTLWDISMRYLGNPWYWQKVWALNPQVSNPHWIYPGNTIYMRPDGMMDSDLALRSGTRGTDDLGAIPEMFDEEAAGSVREGGKYRLEDFQKGAAKHSFYDFRRDGFIAKNELKNSGRLTNSPEDRFYLSVGDDAYIKPRQINNFAIGQTYEIFRTLGEVEHPVTGDDLGYKIRILGSARVTRISKKAVTVKIEHSYEAIVRGDEVRPWRNPVKDVRPRRNKVSLNGYIVDYLEENPFVSQDQIVFLDRGLKDGVQEGNRFFVIRQLDHFGDSYWDDIDKEDLPYEKIGELIVLSVGSKTAAALVMRSLMTIKNGDKIVMEKNY